jgi:hypothetical protein
LALSKSFLADMQSDKPVTIDNVYAIRYFMCIRGFAEKVK